MSSYVDKGGFMQIHNSLDKTISHEVKIKILRILFSIDTDWTGRQLAKKLKVSPTTANKFLKELVGESIVNVKGIGKSYLYSLNNKNYVVKNLLKPFFEKENGILDALVTPIKRVLLKTNAKIESSAIFGSIAQKTETSKSDIDLLIILHNLKDKKKIETALDEISTIIAEDFQTSIFPYILSQEQFKKRYKEKRPIINKILKSYILITGRPLERIII